MVLFAPFKVLAFVDALKSLKTQNTIKKGFYIMKTINSKTGVTQDLQDSILSALENNDKVVILFAGATRIKIRIYVNQLKKMLQNVVATIEKDNYVTVRKMTIEEEKQPQSKKYTLTIENEKREMLLKLEAKNPTWLLEKHMFFVRGTKNYSILKSLIIDTNGNCIHVSTYSNPKEL